MTKWNHFIGILHCVKSVRIWSYSGLHFPAFALNTERYSVSLRIQSKCWKIPTRITPNTGTFYTRLEVPFIKISVYFNFLRQYLYQFITAENVKAVTSLQPWKKYMRRTLVFMRKSEVRENFSFYFSAVFC